MKKIFLSFVFSLTILLGFSQTKGTHEFELTVGGPTRNDFRDVANQIIESVIAAGNTTYTNKSSTPSIAISYKTTIKDNWLIYADGVYQSVKENVLVKNNQVGDINNSYVTFGVGTEYHYIYKPWFQMYSGASIGFTAQYSNFKGSSSDLKDGHDGYFNFQVNALGFRFGKKLAGIIELGAGYKGVANIGLSYQF